MELLIALILMTTVGLSTTVGMSYLINNRFPRPLWALLVSWWWPFRNEDAATLIASALDLDEDCSEWEAYSYDRNMLRLRSVDGKFTIDFSSVHEGRGIVKVANGGINSYSEFKARPTAWSDNALYRAAWRWRLRRNRSSASQMNKNKMLHSQKATLETATYLKKKFQKKLEKTS